MFAFKGFFRGRVLPPINQIMQSEIDREKQVLFCAENIFDSFVAATKCRQVSP